MSIENDIYDCKNDIETLKDKYNDIVKVLESLLANSIYVDKDGDTLCRYCDFLRAKHEDNCPTKLINIL